MGPAIIIPLAAFATAIILGIGVPLIKALIRRMDADSRQPRVPSEVAQRLERMEQALEAVAIEVERISEGQRFTTKLLSDAPNRSKES
jgi:hypothetical protein